MLGHTRSYAFTLHRTSPEHLAKSRVTGAPRFRVEIRRRNRVRVRIRVRVRVMVSSRDQA